MENEAKNLTATQLEARRANAKKSTGPRTPDGKRRSNHNARKHGLYSHSAFFREAAIIQGLKNSMTERLAEEIADVGREYQLFRNTRAARRAATAPWHPQWAVLIRQQNSLHRQLERRIRLLKEMQHQRQVKEEGFADRHEVRIRGTLPLSRN